MRLRSNCGPRLSSNDPAAKRNCNRPITVMIALALHNSYCTARRSRDKPSANSPGLTCPRRYPACWSISNLPSLPYLGLLPRVPFALGEARLVLAHGFVEILAFDVGERLREHLQGMHEMIVPGAGVAQRQVRGFVREGCDLQQGRCGVRVEMGIRTVRPFLADLRVASVDRAST